MRRYCYLLPVIALLCACTATNQYTKSKLNGTWVLERINDQRIATDERLSFTVNDKEKAIYCQTDNQSVWKECDFKWKFEGDTFTLTGTDAKGSQMNRPNTLKVVNDTMMIFSYDTTPNGSATPQSTSNQYRRVLTSKSKYLGTWQVIDGTIDSINKVRYVFSETGTYDYYSLKNETWVKNETNGGSWFTYGDFIVMNAPSANDGGVIKAQLWDTSLASVGSDKTWLQTNTDAGGAMLKSRTLKFIIK